MTNESRFVGVDVGAETIKVVELRGREGSLTWTRRQVVDHNKTPGVVLRQVLEGWGWSGVDSACASGRIGRQVCLPHVPTPAAQAAAWRFLGHQGPGTVISIGSHGFSVLELRPGGADVFRENSRCSQGTGNFLRQLVERFQLGIEEAAELCATVDDPAPLSGRCPVILKTDMTHLANKGEKRARILAGLFDAVCENVQVLVKPRISPPSVVLVGGVGRSVRVRDNLRRFLTRHDMQLLPLHGDDGLYFEALGAALQAAREPRRPPALDELVAPPARSTLETVPSLKAFLPRVKRLTAAASSFPGPGDVILGFDIGSTGSKAVALDVLTGQPRWEGYLRTNGDPVGAAQALMRQFRAGPSRDCPVKGLGVTGSGREIVGSLMTTCYGGEAVYVINEIAAHAEGACHFDPRVDTIFEIGGQDAKYIRLQDGRVVDAAMNEACSAGTGSFIEEQGRRFQGITDVKQLAEEGLEAPCGVSLGQHCSVFMAEIIDEAVSQGVEQRSIMAGIYDSIIQNYLNRVKGTRSVGKVIFCQGMPFAANALAAAVARQTGSEVIIPPNPGTIGALGIGMLARRTLDVASRPAVDPERFLTAGVESKDTFVCRSTKGCGGAGNKCRIDRLNTVVAGNRQVFTWGGGCSLYDKGTRKRKLPDGAPDPFREREESIASMVAKLVQKRGGKTVGLTDEFLLKGLFPFFAHFFHDLGFDIVVPQGANQSALKRGIEESHVPFCAPMQLFHGLVASMADGRPDYLFLPMLRESTRVRNEAHAVVCPVVQASPDMLRWDLAGAITSKVLRPLFDMGPGNLESKEFAAGLLHLAEELGLSDADWRRAYVVGLDAQRVFDAERLATGRRALAFCAEHGIVPVVVLGRAYTIYNTVLNSNVPAILREQGAMAIPVDCYPVDDDVPVFDSMFWSYGQQNLRVAHQVRRTPGTYAIYCSNYSCGPDSFTLHFFSYVMGGRPFAVIETDGHSGDAGTKTRVEAFLHCVRQDQEAPGQGVVADLHQLELKGASMGAVVRDGGNLVIPRMGHSAELVAAALRGMGVRAECLPSPGREAIRLGRRHTSGKECVPMCMTLGSLLLRIESEPDPDKRFNFLMPTAYGPCRFGVYNLLDKVVLERLGLADRVSVLSPDFRDYFADLPDGFVAFFFSGLMAADTLQEALYDVRPREKRPGLAQEIHDRYKAEVMERLEHPRRELLTGPAALMQVMTGRLFGFTDILARAARDFAEAKLTRAMPTVILVGEIYVRCEPAANDDIVRKLEERGIHVRFAPFTEWLEYTDVVNFRNGDARGFGQRLSSFVRGLIQMRTYAVVAPKLGWPPATTAEDSLEASAPYLDGEFQGESVLTLGGPIHEWRQGHVDGVVSVGPLECMPNRIAESQFFHVAEQEGLPSLSISVNGDPIAPEALDNFVHTLHTRFAAEKDGRHAHRGNVPPWMRWSDMSVRAAREAMRLLPLPPPAPPRTSPEMRPPPRRTRRTDDADA